MKAFALVLAGLMASGTAQAGQPFEESLVECAVLIEALTGDQTPVPGQNAMLDYYVGTATNMRAEAERMRNASYVSEMAVQKRVVWEKRWEDGNWDDPANRQEVADWMQYCFKFAEHLGVEGPTPFDK